jgi:hypothetical protein
VEVVHGSIIRPFLHLFLIGRHLPDETSLLGLTRLKARYDPRQARPYSAKIAEENWLGCRFGGRVPSSGRVSGSPPAGNAGLYNESCAGWSWQRCSSRRRRSHKRRSHFLALVNNRARQLPRNLR